MGTVIGPFDRDEWTTILMLKKHIRYQESKKRPDFEKTIRADKGLFAKYIGKEVA